RVRVRGCVGGAGRHRAVHRSGAAGAHRRPVERAAGGGEHDDPCTVRGDAPHATGGERVRAMRLASLTAEVVQRAIAVYQDLAYGQGRPRRPIEAPQEGGLDALLALFQKEQAETIPGYPCHRYTLRLGNRNYPFMKLLL